MRIAVLVKQIPKFEEMALGPDGRLRRDGIEPEMNPYCRRAVSQAVTVGSELGDRVEIKQGLAGGETVIIHADNLTDGARVKVKSGTN